MTRVPAPGVPAGGTLFPNRTPTKQPGHRSEVFCRSRRNGWPDASHHRGRSRGPATLHPFGLAPMNRVLITGADQPLGKLVTEALSTTADLRLTGYEPPSSEGPNFVVSELREPEQAAKLCEGIDVILHLAPYHRVAAPNPKAERQVLDQAARGTFVLCHAARKAGVSRIVLASRLDVVSAYPEDYVVDETWAPLPHPDAVSLAPYMAELTLREFVRAEDHVGDCLRLGELGEQ